MNFHKTFFIIFSMTMISRITGLIREILFARTFGTSAYTDAFNIAFRIPNLLRRLFAEGLFSQALIPILVEYKNKQNSNATKKLISHIITVLIWILFITNIIVIFAAPIIIYFIATGLQHYEDAFKSSIVMTRIMFPYISCMAFVALATSILNIYGKFAIPAFTSTILNISFIFASLFIAPYLEKPIYAIAFAVFIGGILQVLLQIPMLINIDMLPTLYWNPIISLNNKDVQRILKKIGSAVFAVSIAQISLIINTNIASHLSYGSISWLSYADRLMEFPTALLGVTLGVILLPNLSKAYNTNDIFQYSTLLDLGLRLTFLFALPCAICLIILSEPLIATLFHYGEFNAHDVNMSSRALVGYGIGLVGVILVKVLAPGFYAKHDIYTPTKIAVTVLIVTQLMNCIFVPYIAHAGLTLSIGLGAYLNAGLLFFKLRRLKIYIPQPGWKLFFIKLIIASILLIMIELLIAKKFNWIALRAQPIQRINALFLVLVSCFLTYFSALFLMGFRLCHFIQYKK